MANQDFDINNVTTRVRQLILKYKAVQKDNDELYAMVEDRDRQIEELKKKVAESQKQYETLKMAKMIEVSDGDMEQTKKRMHSLIRKVNLCIAMMSEHNDEQNKSE